MGYHAPPTAAGVYVLDTGADYPFTLEKKIDSSPSVDSAPSRGISEGLRLRNNWLCFVVVDFIISFLFTHI